MINKSNNVYLKKQKCKARNITSTAAVQVCGDIPYEIALRFANCNLKCCLCFAAGYSYADKFRGNKEVKNDISVSKCVTDYKDIPIPKNYNGYNWMRILGGEPLFNKEYISYLFDFIDAAADLGTGKFNSSIVIQTNGIYIGQGKTDILYQRLSQLEKTHPDLLIVIETSIKGTNPDEFHIVTQAPKDLYEYNIKSYFNLKDLELPNLRPMVVAGFGINTSALMGNENKKITLFENDTPFYHPSRWDKHFRMLYEDYTNTYSKHDKLFQKMPMYGIEDRPGWGWAFHPIRRTRGNIPDKFYDNNFNKQNKVLESKFNDIKKMFFFKQPNIYYNAMIKKT